MKPSLFAALFATVLLFHPLSGATQQSPLPAPVEGIEWRAGTAIEGGLSFARTRRLPLTESLEVFAPEHPEDSFSG